MVSTIQHRVNNTLHKGSAKWLGYIGLTALLAVMAFTAVNRVTDTPPHYDGETNVRYAYNLSKYGVYAYNTVETSSDLKPSMFREPFYPAVLSIWMKAVIDFSDTSLECLISSDDRCKSARESLKWLMWIFLLALSAGTYFVAIQLSGSALVGLASAVFVGLNPHYLLFADRFYTEIPAAFLLLIHCYALTQLNRQRSLAMCLVAATSLGLLILTKAVFYYWLLLLIPVFLMFALRRSLPWKLVVTFLVAASMLPALWIVRNTITNGEPYITARGGEILAIRAEYTTMSWSEYWSAYLYYTPMIRDQAIEAFGEDRFALFDRQNPDGYYRRVKNGGGVAQNRAGGEDEAKVRKYAIEVILENWPKQLALIPLFAYRGVLQIDDSRRFLVQTTLPAWGFFIGSFIALFWRHKQYLIFILPIWFSIAFHAILTQFIPRFTLPSVPVMTVCAFWMGWMVLRHFMPRFTAAIDSRTTLPVNNALDP